MCDVPGPPQQRARDLHCRRTRLRPHRPGIRHQPTLGPPLVRKSACRKSRTCRSVRSASREPATVSQVIPEGAGPCQAGGLRFLPGFPDGGGAYRTGPRASPGAWVSPVSRLVPIRVSGLRGSRTGQGPAGGAGAAGVLDAEGRDPIIGRREQGGGLRLWWLRAPWAALVLARLAAVIPSGSPRLAAAGHGAGPRGQRDQSG